MNIILIKELHETAMQVAGEVDCRFLHRERERKTLYNASFILEKECYSIIDRSDYHTKSIIGVSAAAFAYKAGMFKEAVQMIFDLYKDGFMFKYASEMSLDIIDGIEQDHKERISKKTYAKMQRLKKDLLSMHLKTEEEDTDLKEL